MPLKKMDILRSSRLALLLAMITGAMALLSGCAQKTPLVAQTTYHHLDYPVPAVSKKPPLPIVLHVEPFTCAPFLRDRRILYQPDKGRIDRYHYHKWSAMPHDLVTHFLARDLLQTGLFKAVFNQDPGAPATHMLRGHLERFSEIDAADGWQAALSVTIALQKADDASPVQTVLWQKRYQYKAPCAQRSPAAVARALGVAMQRFSSELSKDLYPLLEK